MTFNKWIADPNSRTAISTTVTALFTIVLAGSDIVKRKADEEGIVRRQQSTICSRTSIEGGIYAASVLDYL
jgi:hypothetical protein